MTGEIKKVVVLGASGTVGRALLPALHAAGISIVTVTRPDSTSTFPSYATSHRIAYTDLDELTKVFTGYDAVVSAVAPFGVPSQKIAIDAAVAAGVKRFIPSEFGLDTSLERAAEVAPFVVGKQQIVKYLKEKEKDGLSWTAVCSSAFFPWQLELGGGKMGWNVASQKATLFDGGTQPYDASTVPQVARAIVSVLRHPTETANQHVYIKSFTLSQRRVLDALERYTSQKFEVSHASAADVQTEGLQMVKQGNLKEGYPKITTGVAFGPWGLGEFGNKTEHWMTLLGLELEEDKFEGVVRECVERMGIGQEGGSH